MSKSERPEFFGSKGCIIQLGRSRNNNRTMRQLKDMILALSNSSSKKFQSNLEYLQKSIHEAFDNRKIDNFEAMWLQRLIDSEEVNFCLDLIGYDPKMEKALEVYNQSK